MIAIVDYGLGNISAFANIYAQAGIPYRISRTAEDLSRATHVILPGVGAFDQAMIRLKATGAADVLKELPARGVPLLGICVGMQVLLDTSDEGSERGLGLIAGHCRQLPKGTTTERRRIPHMGWNDVSVVGDAPLLNELKNMQFYFLHSFYCEPEDGFSVAGSTKYGIEFASVLSRGYVHGVQFHPEKSHEAGTALLLNFAAL